MNLVLEIQLAPKQMGKKRDGVGTADCREMISGDWELGRERLLKRVELNDEKDFEIEFLASDLFWMNFMGVTPSEDHTV